MTLTFGLAVYFMVWWIVLFAILPFGIRRTQEEAGEVSPGTEASAPDRPHFLRVIVMTSVVTTIVFLGYYWIRESGLTLEDISFLTPPSMR
ncbi:DUF1467 family protein [Roseibium algae]|uniref:DUF1467 family protein n=1 Tax=Roseibium algae TaxID=3123038 RepID=A0ABU8TJH1_9HYPH